MQTLDFNTILCVLEKNPVGMILCDDSASIVYHNQKAASLFGYTCEQMKGLKIERLIPPRFNLRHKVLRDEFRAFPQPKEMHDNRILPAITKDGQEIPLRIGLSPLNVENKQYTLVTLLECPEKNQLDELEKTNKALSEAATHDYLTGLSNRRLFIELGEKLLSLAARHHQFIALLFIDLDHFKQVNDNHGHAIGDKLLIKVAQVLDRHIRKSDVLSRVGGDEFLICLNEVCSKDNVIDICQQLLKDVAAIDHVEGKKVKIGASIGAVMAQAQDNMKLLNLVELADKAMYQAKAKGKNTVVFNML